MAIPPSGPPASPALGSFAKKGASLDDTNAGRAMDTEKRAAARAADAEKKIETTQREENEQLDRLKDEYVRQSTAEQERQSNALETEKNKGYERIRELQRAQQAEINRVKREGERDLSKLTDYYRNTHYRTESEGNEKLRDLQNRLGQETGYAQKSGLTELDNVKDTYAKQEQQLRENSEERNARLAQAARAEYERMRTGYARAGDDSQKKFQDKFESITGSQKEVLDQLENRASQKIRAIRADTSEKLSAYYRRQADPFYKMMDLGAKLQDAGDFYVLTARIPEHEQKHVSISLKGDNLVVSGYRRNEEKLEPAPGRVQETSSYQSYSESFPLLWPVEGRALTKEFSGDRLTVTVPKRTRTEPYRQFRSTQVERARVELPRFPDNIPVNPHTPEPEAPPERPDKKYPGGGTLG